MPDVAAIEAALASPDLVEVLSRQEDSAAEHIDGLLTHAKKLTQGGVAQFALLDEATRLAERHALLDQAMAAIGELAKSFELDAEERALALVEAVAATDAARSRKGGAELRAAIAAVCLRSSRDLLVRVPMRRSQVDRAEQFAEFASKLKLRDKSLEKEIDQRGNVVEAFRSLVDATDREAGRRLSSKERTARTMAATFLLEAAPPERTWRQAIVWLADLRAESFAPLLAAKSDVPRTSAEAVEMARHAHSAAMSEPEASLVLALAELTRCWLDRAEQLAKTDADKLAVLAEKNRVRKEMATRLVPIASLEVRQVSGFGQVFAHPSQLDGFEKGVYGKLMVADDLVFNPGNDSIAEVEVPLDRAMLHLSGEVQVVGIREQELQFTIRSDKEELWASDVVTKDSANRGQKFSVALGKAKRLFLCCTCKGDRSGAWTIWRHPVILVEP